MNNQRLQEEHLLDEFSRRGETWLLHRNKMKQKIKARQAFRRYAYAAGFALLIGVASWRIFGSNEEMTTLNYPPYNLISKELLASVRSSNNKSVTKEQAAQLYETKKFVAAEKAFNALYLSTQSTEYLLFEGHCALQHNPQKAHDVLSELLQKNDLDAVYEDYAKWYLVWANLALKDTVTAKIILEDLLVSPISDEINADAQLLWQTIE
ncbi:MAG: hypothetical protein R2795_24440 [Saprospiraceae bacterium]